MSQRDAQLGPVVLSGMRIVLTDHAVDRYIKRIDPSADARAVRSYLHAQIPHDTGEVTRNGQPVWRFGDCDAVVKIVRDYDGHNHRGRREHQHNGRRRSQREEIALVVTVLPIGETVEDDE